MKKLQATLESALGFLVFFLNSHNFLINETKKKLIVLIVSLFDDPYNKKKNVNPATIGPWRLGNPAPKTENETVRFLLVANLF